MLICLFSPLVSFGVPTRAPADLGFGRPITVTPGHCEYAPQPHWRQHGLTVSLPPSVIAGRAGRPAAVSAALLAAAKMSFPEIPSVNVGNGIRRSPLFKDGLLSIPYPDEPDVNTTCTFQ